MPSVVASIGIAALKVVGVTVVAAEATALAMAGVYLTGTAVILAGVQAMNYALRQIPAMDVAFTKGDSARDITSRSTVEPMKIVYGEAVVSGPVSFVGAAGDKNKDLWTVVCLAGHQCNAITDVYFDDIRIVQADIGSGAAAGGEVGGTGTFRKVWVDSTLTPIVKINKHLGSSTQTHDTDLAAAFTQVTDAWDGRGIAYLATRCTLIEESQATWDKEGSPRNIRAKVQGRLIYDPRNDTSPGANPTNIAYAPYSANPALCVADYLTNTVFGMGIPPDKIDWDTVVTMANGCDNNVVIPGDTVEDRFTCNGALYTTDSHQTNIEKLLSSMNGSLVYSAGKYYILAGVFESQSGTLTEDSLRGAIGLKTGFERDARYNTVSAVYINPAANYKMTDMPKVVDTGAVSRDNDETLLREIKLPMTNSSYGAQRIAMKLLKQTDYQLTCTYPCNLTGLNYKPGDRLTVTNADLNWNAKIFRVINWKFSDAGASVGVDLTLREDNSAAWDAPVAGEYSTTTAGGTITSGVVGGISPPTSLTATNVIEGIELNWVNPVSLQSFQTIAVYAAANGDANNWADAVEIGRTNGTQFLHDASNAADALSPGNQRWYWVVARRYGTGDDEGVSISVREPDTTQSTVTATAGESPAPAAVTSDGDALQQWFKRAATVWAPSDNTLSLTAKFYRQATAAMATREILGTLNTTTGVVTLTNVTNTGEATTYTLPAASASPTLLIEHTASGMTQRLSWEALDTASYSSNGDQEMVWWSGSAGNWDPSDHTKTRTARFYSGGTEIASRDADSTLTTSGTDEGDIAVSDGGSTGEATTISISNNNTNDVDALVTHTASGMQVTINFSAVSTYSGGPGK